MTLSEQINNMQEQTVATTKKLKALSQFALGKDRRWTQLV